MNAITHKLNKAEIVLEQGHVTHAKEILYEIIFPFGVSDGLCAVSSEVEPVNVVQALAQLMACNKVSFLQGQISATEYRQTVNSLYEQGMLFAARGGTGRARNGMRQQFAQLHYLLGESMFLMSDYTQTTSAITRHLFEAVYKTKASELSFPSFASLYALSEVMSGRHYAGVKGVQWMLRALRHHIQNRSEYDDNELWRWHAIHSDMNMRYAAGMHKLGDMVQAKEALTFARVSAIFLKEKFCMPTRERQCQLLANRVLSKVVH